MKIILTNDNLNYLYINNKKIYPMFTDIDQVPIKGYLMPLWNYGGYRATALAYMQREGLNSIENYNGRWYTLSEIKNAMIGSNN